MSPSNKDLSKSAQLILKELGHDISIGHAYELLSKLAGYNSWNVANAAGVNLNQALNKAKSTDDVLDQSRLQFVGTPTHPLRVSMTASATVEISTEMFPKDPGDTHAIKRTFLAKLQNNPDAFDVRIVEPPIAPYNDIEIEEGDSSNPVYLRREGVVTPAVAGRHVRLGEGKHVFEAKLKVQSEAKLYLAIHADSEEEAKKLADDFVAEGDYEYLDVIGTEDACKASDWEVTALESTPYVEYVWKRTK